MEFITRLIHKYPFGIVAGGCIFVTLLCSVFLYGNLQNQVDAINTEREDRLISFARVVSENCQENNDQDNILAGLLQISIQATPPTGTLTRQELRGLRVFSEALVELERTSPCRILVKNLLVEQGLSQAQIQQIVGAAEVPKTQNRGTDAKNHAG